MKNKLYNALYGPFISCDIGTHSIKIVEGKATGGGINVEAAINLPTPEDSVKDGRITNINKLAAAIANALEKEGIKGKRLIFTIESTAVITREFLLPTIKEDEIDSILEFEMQQYLPVNLENYVIQKKLLEEVRDVGGNKSNIQVAVLPKEIVTEYYQLAGLLKLKPVALDLNFNSIYKLITEKALINNNNVSSKIIAVIEIGYKSINVVIIDKGILKFHRLIQSGSYEVDNCIANILNISLLEAEGKKNSIKDIKGDSFTSLEDSLIIDNIRSIVDGWIYDIERLFRYYSSRDLNNRIDSIYLYGGGSRLKGLEDYFKDLFQLPTSRLIEIGGISRSKNSLTTDLQGYFNSIGAIIGR